MKDDDKYEFLSEEFSRIDNEIHQIAKEDARVSPASLVMGLKGPEKVLYFVMDLLAVTCNAGMGAWVDYHVKDAGWIDEAINSYDSIGYPEVSLALKASRECYIREGLAVEGLNYSQYSKVLWDQEIEIVRSMYFRYTGVSGDDD